MKTTLLLLITLAACSPQTEETKAETVCKNILRCFPKANYGACVSGSIQGNRALPADERDLDWQKSIYNSEQSCPDLELTFYRAGMDMSGAK